MSTSKRSYLKLADAQRPEWVPLFDSNPWLHVNPLNPSELRDWVFKLVNNEEEHIFIWFTTTFLRQYPSSIWNGWRQCRNEAELRAIEWPLALARGLTVDCFQGVRREHLPDWARDILDQNALWCWDPNSEGVKHLRDVLLHWRDYMRTLPKRSIAMSVYQMEAMVDLWDQQLAKQKLVGEQGQGVMFSSLYRAPDGTRHVHFPREEDAHYYMVELKTKAAFDFEGSKQRHCVAGYFERDHTRIFSLRSLNSPTGLALATIEVRHDKVVQIRGPFNKAVSEQDMKCIEFWATVTHRFSLDLYDDDDEEHEYEYEDEEDAAED